MSVRSVLTLLALFALLPHAALAADDGVQSMEYVPRPASSYALTPADVGPGFREFARNEPEGGAIVGVRLVPADVRQIGNVLFSPTDVAFVDSWVFIEPYGSDAEVQTRFNTTLDTLRSRYGANVQPAVGWGSEQVYSFAWAQGQMMARGTALKHRNAVVLVEMVGTQQQATWDRLANLTRIVERRIHAAIQQ